MVGFSKISALLTRLMQKEVKFEWDKKCKQGFQELKARLTMTLILAMPTESRKYVVYSNASRIGLECVLLQEMKVLAYGSRQLKMHEQNYPTHNLELTTIIYVFKLWRHYLYEEQFEIFTDHKNFKYIFSQNELNMQQRRWM